MKVFVTGATGFVGTGVIRELLAAGHTVTAIARTPEGVQKLTKAGVSGCLGNLTDLARLRAAAAEADAVIHCAYNHSLSRADIMTVLLLVLTRGRFFSMLSPTARMDRNAIHAIIEGLIANGATGKVFVSTGGIAGLVDGRIATERDLADPAAFGGVGGLRAPSERIVLAAARRGVRTAVIRLPPSVHGPNDHGFVPTLTTIARRTGISAYLGTGENCWSAVHRDDAAVLYRLAVEQLAAGTLPAGSPLNAVADEGIPLRQIAAAIADQLGLGTPEPRPNKHFGFFARFVAIDAPATSTLTQQSTGWKPTRCGLLEDVRSPEYATAQGAAFGLVEQDNKV